MPDYRYPQIKVCGLTQPDQARAVAELGADAIGLVFYPKSPRNVSPEQAAAITSVLPSQVIAVGVFVDSDLEMLTQIVNQCRLQTVQLHGSESPEFVEALRETLDIRIVKALFASRSPRMEDAGEYTVDGYLVECGRGKLPGGNALTWDWASAETFAARHHLALAGGLGPETVVQAISVCLPDAVDASSALEAAPGRKDLRKVAHFIEQVRLTRGLYKACRKEITPIF